jgi:hydroxylamine dehydrogenase
MKYLSTCCSIAVLLTSASVQTARSQEIPLSAETEECLVCHAETHPGMVASWQKGRHSRITPHEALQKPELERRVSSADIDSSLLSVAVGCYECHSLNTGRHKDAFEHNGYTINVIVSPDDCATCHAVETDEYSRNLMAHAHANLMENGLYQTLIKSVNNPHSYANSDLTIGDTDTLTLYESCLYCHGTKVEVKGFVTKQTDLGEFQFPVLEGWPNQGVGRINPDGSKGACTACHPRHDFSIETARKPYTCAECHKGPDVPAFKVYEASKHGNIFKSKGQEYDFNAVPWTVGKDFTVPTCATCHVSLVVGPDETVISERTHQFNDRLAWRLFGVPYAYPHPAKADLRNVKNSQGLPLAVELNGEPVTEFVISKEEQQARDVRMKKMCLSCHNSEWVDNHFIRLENTIQKTNEITYEATKVLMDIWNGGYAEGLPQGKNIFDEEPERVWTSLWLFHTNSTRFASAMAGGGDYGVFANGRYQTTGELYKLLEKLQTYKGIHGK